MLGVKTSSRIDPLAVRAKAGPVYEGKDGEWTLDAKQARIEKGKPVLKGKERKPAGANHGNIPPSLSQRARDPLDEDAGIYLAGGVTIAYAEQTTVLSLPALRRLRLSLERRRKSDPLTDLAAQTVLAALGLCGGCAGRGTGA